MRLINADERKQQIESPYTEYPIMIQIRKALKDFLDDAPTIDAIPREEHEAIVYAREQIAYNRGLMDGRKEQLMTSGYVTTVSETATEPVSVYTYANSELQKTITERGEE